jgi:hypothetical protein
MAFVFKYGHGLMGLSHSGVPSVNILAEASYVLGMMLSQGEVMVIVVITAVVVFIVARKRNVK